MVETKEIKNEILRALDRFEVNENPDVVTRKLDSIISICESKKRYLKENRDKFR